jgi:Spy/CpxP family protein refolding chaperone
MKTQFFAFSRNLRLIIPLAVLFMFCATALLAQKQGPGGYGKATPEERAKRQTEMMKENLSLTAAQEPKVSAINLKYAKKMEDVRKIADTTVQRKTFQNLNKQKDGELKAVLTADQFKSYLKQVEEMKAQRRGMQH